MIYEIISASELELIYKCANINEQLPILANQLSKDHYNLS